MYKLSRVHCIYGEGFLEDEHTCPWIRVKKMKFGRIENDIECWMKETFNDLYIEWTDFEEAFLRVPPSINAQQLLTLQSWAQNRKRNII